MSNHGGKNMSDPSNTHPPGVTRRSFVRAGGAALATLGATGQAYAMREALAINGGPKAVTFPAAQETRLTKWPRYGAAEKKALHDLIDSGKFYQELPLFEKEWSEYTGSPFVKAHMNGSSALTSMYFALDLPPGSEIMVPSYTFFSTCLAMRFSGYVPIFVDVDPKTVCFDLDDAKKKLTPRTKALVAMHSWGLPCEMDKILGWAREKGLILLEDAAQSHGAEMQGRKMGAWGAMGIYSFQTSKGLPAVEGGAGLYQTREYFERAAAFGHYEDPPKFPKDSPVRAYEGTGFGQKYRMHPFAAAVVRVQLRGLDERNAVAAKNVRVLNDRITQLPGLSEPRVRPDQKRVYYYANMLLLDEKKAGFGRDALLKALQAEGVRASIWDYPEQHRLKIYSEAKWWHHPPQIPPRMPGNAQVNKTHIFLPIPYAEAPELIDQWVRALEKVWAHRGEVAKL
ncbi:MAG: DegT/DnrJ/EryC1/StrS family aminotransferase [Acidobacteria bacterium]|nr:DegT/DnrJ/EryC1/StrS family aminotransferase [Acidobacteriota bacterium]